MDKYSQMKTDSRMEKYATIKKMPQWKDATIKKEPQWKRCHTEKMPHRKNMLKCNNKTKWPKNNMPKQIGKDPHTKWGKSYLSLAQRHESYKRIHLKGKGIGYLKAGVDSGMCGLQSSVIDTQCQQCQ